MAANLNHVHHHESCRATSNPKDVRFNCQENARLRLVTTRYPRVCHLEYLPFCVRGKFSQLARGNRGLMVVKGLNNKNVSRAGLYAMALRICQTLKTFAMEPSDPMHEGVHEEEDISILHHGKIVPICQIPAVV
ncbi:hypothetical protein TNCV_1615621 [Trichonephila clavipes]|nr:hypothetical protein TNCV_1615621 [Trichonephila clavipes]